MRRLKTLLLASIAGLIIPATAAFPATPSDDDGPPGSGRFRIRPVLRLNLDAVSVTPDDGETTVRGSIRRLRVGVAGRVGDKLRYRVERELSGDGGWRNAYVALRPHADWEVRAGNMIAPVSLEDMQGASDQSLAERSVANALAPGFATGIQVSQSGRRHTVTVGYFGPALRDEDGSATAEGYGIAGRATRLVVDGDRWKVHAGAGFERRSNRDDGRERVSARASGPYGPVVVRTPALSDVRSRTTVSLEGAVVRGPVAVQAQYVVTDLQRRSGRNVRYSGGYVQGSWMIDGGRYSYDRRRGMPETDRNKGRGYEVLGRVSQVNLNSGDVTGGRAVSVEIGGAVHLNDRLSLTSTAGVTRYRPGRSGAEQTGTVWVTRLSARF
ncbi:porin [Asticcacaulis biprosthecium]|nr:porin [Asticcacaulis biprosthecium]